MDLEDLFKKLRSSLSMRKNIPLSQLIEECNSDWNINVKKIYSEISLIPNSDLKDIVKWLETYESVYVKNTESRDYIITFKFGDEHADLRRYINVSKPKRKSTNRKTTSISMRKFREQNDPNISRRRRNNSKIRYASSTPLNNYHRQKKNVKHNEPGNIISTEATNVVRTLSNTAKTHFKNVITNTNFMNKRLENQRNMERLQNEIVEEFSNVILDETNEKTDKSFMEKKIYNKSTSHQTQKFFVRNDFKDDNEKVNENKLRKNNKKDVPKYICGIDAIEAMLKERKRVVLKGTEKMSKIQEETQIKEEVKESDKSEKPSIVEVRKPFIILQSPSPNPDDTSIYKSSISNEKSVKGVNLKKIENNERKVKKFKCSFDKKIEKKSRFLYSFPKPAVV